jgi:hypothetical protein
MRHYTEDELTLYHYGEAARRDRIEQHLEQCAACSAAYRDIAGILAAVGDAAVPERDDLYGLEVWQRIRHDLPPREVQWWTAWQRPMLAGGLALLLIAGFVTGRLWPRVEPPPSQGAAQAAQLDELRGELRQMRQMLMLSLLQQQSATERLRGVSGSTEIDNPGNEIVRALLNTLMHDPNVNVRLASVDALRRFSDQAAVRRETTRALADSSFPLVQIALIDFMVETKDREAVDALRQLSEDTAVDEAVRGRAVWGIEQLTS